MGGTVGVVANPVSGKDIRRLVANAGTTTITDKVSIVRRAVVGAVEAGADRLVVLGDAHDICGRAIEALGLDVAVERAEVELTHTGGDSRRGATAMKEAGCGAVVVLGGDGTNRDVAMGWADAPLVPVSTGTNNVFPRMVEPTMAGAAAGLVASGAVELTAVAAQATVVRVRVDGEADDLALVDAVLVEERFVGSRALFDPAALRVAVVTRSDPTTVGIASIAGICGEIDGASVLRFGGDANLRVALAPGSYADVAVASAEPLTPGETVVVTGPGVLALDGERQRVLQDGQRAELQVVADGPMVIDVAAAVAAGRGVFRRGR